MAETTASDDESTDDKAAEQGSPFTDSGYVQGEKRPLDHGTKIRAKVKRGNGTRDQDELLIEGRGESAAEAAADFEEALQRAEDANWADRLRALQPEAEDGEADD